MVDFYNVILMMNMVSMVFFFFIVVFYDDFSMVILFTGVDGDFYGDSMVVLRT